jgi:hypothetical protein
MNTYKKVLISNDGGAQSADELSYNNANSGLLATNVQDALDELSVSVGAAYVGNFLSGAWVLNADKYQLAILQTTHNRGLNPLIQVYENNLGIYEEVGVGIEINNLGDITLIITSNPDTRFAGRVIIK